MATFNIKMGILQLLDAEQDDDVCAVRSDRD
jgi:hypothetical protein